MGHYIDSSALVKLVAREPESNALRAWLRDQPARQFISDLSSVEVTRALAVKGIDDRKTMDQVLSMFDCLRLRPMILEQARLLRPAELRTLDAIHLASAMSVGPDLEGVVTYDHRLIVAAANNGIPVSTPSPHSPG